MLSSIEDGSRALLKDAVAVLADHPRVKYMVIGGWCPVLRNTTGLRHPGTLDVDLLFEKSYRSGSIRGVVKGLMSAGFAPSAKHPFQLLKSQRVKGKDFVFNIDLLHPNMITDEKAIGMFVDHLELDVPLSNQGDELKNVKSIVLSDSRLLFHEGLFSRESIDSVEFNLVTFDGMFITKMTSCQKQKRERDAFDIYLGFLGNSIDLNRVRRISDNDQRTGASLRQFTSFLQNHHEAFDNNVKMFCRDITGSPARLVLAALDG